nr:hypothetical protein mcr_00141 [Micrococcus sp.]
MKTDLNILLANAEMRYQGGTQAWIHQMYRTLSGQHRVSVFTADGPVPQGLTGFVPSEPYDVALINHWPASRALHKADIGLRIVTSHGVIPHEEIPVLGADRYVAVSESVQARIPFRSTVIRNPIDTNHFRSETGPSPRLRKIAFVSNRQGRALPLVQEAVGRLGLELRVVGKETAVKDPVEVYQWADLVIGIARVAMEALACGRNVLALDYMGFHGLIDRDNVQRLMHSNYGGHAHGEWPTVNVLMEEMRRYDARMDLRDHVQEYHHPSAVAGAYLDLARSSAPSRIARAIRQGPKQLSSPKITQMLQAGSHLTSLVRRSASQ